MGSQYRPAWPAYPTAGSPSSAAGSQTDAPGSGGAGCSAGGPVQHGSSGGHRARYSARRDIQEHALHGTQERWSMEASVQPQSAERVCGQLPFQDGNVGSRTRASSAELVVGETRSEGRLSLGTGAHSQPTPPPVHVERPGMAVHLPPVRSVGVTPHVHQGASSSSSVAPYNGSAHRCLSGRLAVDSTLPCSSGAADPVCGSPPRTTGLHSQPPEIYHGADADPDVSRSRSELGAHGIFLASRQAGQDSLRVPSPAQQGICYPRRTAFTDRQDGCSAPCSTPRYASCPGTAVPAERGSGTPSRDPTVGRMGLQRPALVDNDGGVPDTHAQRPTLGHHELRCVQCRMGCCCGYGACRWAMVRVRSCAPHQLERADRGMVRFEKPAPQRIQPNHPVGNRQYDHRGIPQSSGRHSFSASVYACDSGAGVGCSPTPGAGSGSCARSPEPHSRLSVPSRGGDGRLDAPVPCVYYHPTDIRPAECRSVCGPPQCSPAPLPELASRSRGRSSGCLLHPSRAMGECLCLSAIQPAHPVSSLHPATRHSTGNRGGSSLAVTGLLPSAAPNVLQCSATTSIVRRSGPTGTSPSTGTMPTTDRMEYLREAASLRGLSQGAVTLWLSSWRTSTNATYQSAWRQWVGWCCERRVDPVSADPTQLANFLATQYEAGKQYRTLNVYRSAVSSTVPPLHDNVPVGQSPSVVRVMRGIYNQRPPLPRYSRTWDVATVLEYIRSLGPNTALTLSHLSWKLCMLLALAKAARVSEICHLDIRAMRFLADGVEFELTHVTKTQRSGGPRKFFVPGLPADPILCPVECIKAYLDVTRSSRTTPAQSALVVSTRRPFQPVSTSTVARWVTTLLQAAGVESDFSAHSTRSASTSAARQAGVSLADVLATADWSRPNTFIRHYYRPHSQASFGQAVLTVSTG